MIANLCPKDKYSVPARFEREGGCNAYEPHTYSSSNKTKRFFFTVLQTKENRDRKKFLLFLHLAATLMWASNETKTLFLSMKIIWLILLKFQFAFLL